MYNKHGEREKIGNREEGRRRQTQPQKDKDEKKKK